MNDARKIRILEKLATPAALQGALASGAASMNKPVSPNVFGGPNSASAQRSASRKGTAGFLGSLASGASSLNNSKPTGNEFGGAQSARLQALRSRRLSRGGTANMLKGMQSGAASLSKPTSANVFQKTSAARVARILEKIAKRS